jgi:LysM domain
MRLIDFSFLSFSILVFCRPEIATPTPPIHPVLVHSPHPIETRMITSCTSFHLVQPGDDCLKIASAKGISLSQFYAWNKGVGSTYEDLLRGYYVCVGVLGTKETPEPFQRSRPTPREERRGEVTLSVVSESLVAVRTGSKSFTSIRTGTRSFIDMRTWTKSLSSPTPSPVEPNTISSCQKFYSKSFLSSINCYRPLTMSPCRDSRR